MAALDEQRELAALLLAAIGPDGFALAGSGAIREHGLSNRPAEDVDLFASATVSEGQFQSAVYRAEQLLCDRGLHVTRSRSFRCSSDCWCRTNSVAPASKSTSASIGGHSRPSS